MEKKWTLDLDISTIITERTNIPLRNIEWSQILLYKKNIKSRKLENQI